jgi:DNA mismatch repair protein MutL
MIFKPTHTTAFTYKSLESSSPHHEYRQEVTHTHETPSLPEKSSVSHEWKIIGQVHKSYLIVESQAGFYVIDQHAAAERINYERLTREYESNVKKVQPLLMPITLELHTREIELLDTAREYVMRLGFDIEKFGQTTIKINGAPQDFVKLDVGRVLKGLIDDLDKEDFEHMHNTREKQHIIVKYAACRGAIMFNDFLTDREQQQLIQDIQNLPRDKWTCCHGRPFLKEFSKKELEKLFHRH